MEPETANAPTEPFEFGFQAAAVPLPAVERRNVGTWLATNGREGTGGIDRGVGIIAAILGRFPGDDRDDRDPN